MNLTLVSADLVHRSGSFGEESKKEIQNRSRIEESEAKSTSKRKENSRTLTLDQPQNQEQRTPGELTSLGRRRSPACGAEQAAAARHCACARGGPLCRTGVPPAATSTAARSPSRERARRRGSRGSAATFPGAGRRRRHRRSESRWPRSGKRGRTWEEKKEGRLGGVRPCRRSLSPAPATTGGAAVNCGEKDGGRRNNG